MKELVTAASAGQSDPGMPSGGEILSGILRQARVMATAEAGMLYMIHQNELRLVLCQNDRRQLPQALADQIAAETPCRPDSLVGFVALTNRIINIPDAGCANGKLPFRLDRDYDLAARYKTVSILAIPIISGGRCAGVLQLINHLATNGTETAFGPGVAQRVAQYLDLATAEILDAYLEHRAQAASTAVATSEETDEPKLAADVPDEPAPIAPAAAAPALPASRIPEPTAPRPVNSAPRPANPAPRIPSPVAPNAPVPAPNANPTLNANPTPNAQSSSPKPRHYVAGASSDSALGSVRVTPSSPIRTLALMTLGYLAFVIYGSLVPLNFHGMAFSEALEKFRHAPYVGFIGESRADWVVNLLLLIPLTFLASGWLNGGRGRSAVVAVAVTCVGVMLSIAIEFAQVFTSRSPSRNDIIAESISGAIGAFLWLAIGPQVTGWMGQIWRYRAAGKRAVHVLLAYTVGYLIYQLQPLDMIYQLNDLYHKFRAGRIVIMPFADAGQLTAYLVFVKIAALIPVGYMMACLGDKGTRMVRVVLGGALVAAGIEFLQVFVDSSHASITDAILGAAGALVGGWIAGRIGPAADRPFLEHPWWKQWGCTVIVLATCAWLACLAVDEWAPFNFAQPGDMSARMSTMFAVPMTHLYMMSPFSAAALVARFLMFSMILTMLVRGLGSGRSGRGAVIFTTLVFVILEGGQVFLASRTPDSTTIALGLGGALIGSRFYTFFVRTFIRPA